MSSLCVLCDRQLGTMFVRNEWGEQYCVSHAQVPGCLWCGSHKKLKEEHDIHSCVDCLNEIVLHDSEVADCAEVVMNWLSSVVGPHNLQSVPIVYGGLTLPASSGGTLGLTTSQWTGTSGSSEISTVGFMPRTALLQLLAHEYGHVLLVFDPLTFHIHPNVPKEDQVIEGFCEVVSSELLRYQGDARSLKMLTRMGRNKDMVYGDGYRKMLPELQSTGGLLPLCASLTGWQVQRPSVPTITPKPLQPSTPNSQDTPIPNRPDSIPMLPIPMNSPPTSTPPTRPESIPMRPVVKRTDKPQTATEHRPHIKMPHVNQKPVVENSQLPKPQRPTIPMKPNL